MRIVIKIATLQGVFIEKEVQMVMLPASDGEIGIMANHIPSVFKLGNGLIKLHDEQARVTEKIFVFGGFSQTYSHKVDVVTDKAIYLKDLDVKLAQNQIKLLESQLMSSGDETFLSSVEKELDLYRKMLEAVALNN
jgi:F-type H+-transporting ATPase subunit epsilon